MPNIPETFQLHKAAKLHDTGDFSVVDIPHRRLLRWGPVHMFVLPPVWAFVFVSVSPCRTPGPAARVPAAPALPSVPLIRTGSRARAWAMPSPSVPVSISISISAPASAPPLLLAAAAAAGFRSKTDDTYMLKGNNRMQRRNHCCINFNGIYFMVEQFLTCVYCC